MNIIGLAIAFALGFVTGIALLIILIARAMNRN